MTQETESQNLTSQSQAMLNLNLKLHSTVLKSQVKAIDLELRELEARQAAEHLAIVKVSVICHSVDRIVALICQTSRVALSSTGLLRV